MHMICNRYGHRMVKVVFLQCIDMCNLSSIPINVSGRLVLIVGKAYTFFTVKSACISLMSSNDRYFREACARMAYAQSPAMHCTCSTTEMCSKSKQCRRGIYCNFNCKCEMKCKNVEKLQN